MPSQDTPYQAYLKSGHWLDLRRRVWRQRGRICECCGSNHEVAAHHLIYRTPLTSCTETDLMLLCKDCHRRVHAHPDIRNLMRKCEDVLARRKMVLQICDSRFNRSRHQKHIRPVDVWYERRERLIRDFKKAEQSRLQRERPTKKGKCWLDYTSIQSRHYRIDEQSKHPTPTTQSGGATRPPSG